MVARMHDEAAAWVTRLGLRAGPDGEHCREYHVTWFRGQALARVGYYLLTSRAPRTAWLRGAADRLYFHHAGGRLRVVTREAGERGAASDRSRGAGERRLGPPDAYQVAVAGGTWQALELVAGSWALISVATLPGTQVDERAAAESSPQPEPWDMSREPDTGEPSRVPEPWDMSREPETGEPSRAPEPWDMSETAAGASRAPELRDMSGIGVSREHEPWDMSQETVTGASLIAGLGLRPHAEGGHFTERWRSGLDVATAAGRRSLGSTIYYLLSAGAAVGYFHRNTADITHLLHSGGPIVYCTISPDGVWREVVLGRDTARGQVLSFTCPGEFFKSSHLGEGAEHGLISEIVAPGFDYADHAMADDALFMRLFPQHRARWAAYVR
jgi:predicted cupin superfamily sugar epimerase